MSKATAAAPPSTANEVPIDRPPRRQSPPTFDCRAATIKPQTTPLRDNHAPSIMPPPRRRIPILIVAAFSSRSPRDNRRRHPCKSQGGKFQFVDEDLDHPNRVLLADIIFQAVR